MSLELASAAFESGGDDSRPIHVRERGRFAATGLARRSA